MNETLLLTLAMVPGLAIAYYIYQRDRYDPEPRSLVIWCFICGCLSTIPPVLLSLFVDDTRLSGGFWDIAFYCFFVIALSEEGSKFMFTRLVAYPNKAFNEPMDGIVYSVMVAMGFATLENVLYSLEHGYGTTIMRAFTAVPAHASFGVLIGAFMGFAKFSKGSQSTIYMLTGLVLAILFHGAYDLFLLQQSYEGLAILALITLAVGIIVSRRLIAFAVRNSPFNPENEGSIVAENDDNFVP